MCLSVVSYSSHEFSEIFFPFFAGKDDIFGETIVEDAGVGKSMYSARALSYCDINKIELSDLKEILQLYPEFAEQFLQKFQITFNLRKVKYRL